MSLPKTVNAKTTMYLFWLELHVTNLTTSERQTLPVQHFDEHLLQLILGGTERRDEGSLNTSHNLKQHTSLESVGSGKQKISISNSRKSSGWECSLSLMISRQIV